MRIFHYVRKVISQIEININISKKMRYNRSKKFIFLRRIIMNTILEELWYGNIGPGGGCRELRKEAKELMGYITKHHDNLQETLTDEQKDILKKLDDCYVELTAMNDRDIFVYAFRLGTKIVIEIISFDNE